MCLPRQVTTYFNFRNDWLDASSHGTRIAATIAGSAYGFTDPDLATGKPDLATGKKALIHVLAGAARVRSSPATAAATSDAAALLLQASRRGPRSLSLTCKAPPMASH